MPTFPVVPDLPGVPPLARSVVNAIGDIASGAGSIAGSVLSVASIFGAPLAPLQYLAATGLAAGTQIVAQLTGEIGAAGDYLLSQAANLAGVNFGVSNFYTPALATSDSLVGAAAGTQPQWGIFDAGGDPVIVPDSVVDVEFRAEQRLAIFPIEAGTFGTYNKVAMPYEGRVKMNRAGSEADRTAFLTAIDAALKSTDLYTFVMPEMTYDNANVDHYDFRRTSENGVQLLTVEVWVQEIRTASSPTLSNTQAASGQDARADGAVQANGTNPQQASQGGAALTTAGPLGGAGSP